MANRFDNSKYDAAFDRCIDVMAQMIIKYGPQILEQKNPAPADNCNATGKNDLAQEDAVLRRKAKKTA